MRRINILIALVAVMGWGEAAHAGSVTQMYSVSQSYGATWSVVYGAGITISGSVTGKMTGAVSTPNSTFTKSVPPASASFHVAGGTITALMSWVGFGWTHQRSVRAALQGSTQFHIGSGGIVPGSNKVTFQVTSKAHCTGPNCNSLLAPSCFPPPYASVTHTNMWTAKSVHLGQATFSHTANSAHYLKSFQGRLVPPLGHTCGSGSGYHLASSESGYHTFHVAGKLATD